MSKHRMAATNLGSPAVILGGIPQVNPDGTQTVPATHQLLGFNSTRVFFFQSPKFTSFLPGQAHYITLNSMKCLLFTSPGNFFKIFSLSIKKKKENTKKSPQSHDASPIKTSQSNGFWSLLKILSLTFFTNSALIPLLLGLSPPFSTEVSLFLLGPLCQIMTIVFSQSLAISDLQNLLTRILESSIYSGELHSALVVVHFKVSAV